ncbi:MAG: DUF192 domain-containing protein [Candidatus Harrisonbacteria bacterium]|nr:DUF192 domain-containing protein [Candidatus Harrisonbacteria bacterium]
MKKFLIALGIFALMIIAFLGVSFVGQKGAESNLPKKALLVGNQFIQVEIAGDPISRSRGLSGRSGLEEGAGMLFVFEASGLPQFWMKGMLFPIDIVWVGDGKIVGVEKEAPPHYGFGDPEIYMAPKPVDMVLEIGAGEFDRLGLKIGDAVVIQ